MRVLTVGSAMIDTIAVIASDRIERMAMRNADASFLLLEEGSKTEALEVSTHCGGGAINTAVAMARLGHEVSTLVKIGTDRRAATVLDRLAAENISQRWVRRDPTAPTGASVILSSHDRNAAIFTHRGANAMLGDEDLADEAFAVDLVYIASLSNESADCFPELIRHSKRHGAMVATNPGIRQLASRGEALLRSLPSIDILMMNRVEAETFAASVLGASSSQLASEIARSSEAASLDWPKSWPRDLPAQVTRPLVHDKTRMGVATFLRDIAALGTRYVLVTCGRYGALLCTGDEVFYCPAVEVDPAGTAGAGDAFAATLTSMLSSTVDCAAALRAAAVNAASVVAFVDTQSGLLDRAALARRVEAVDLRLERWPLR